VHRHKREKTRSPPAPDEQPLVVELLGVAVDRYLPLVEVLLEVEPEPLLEPEDEVPEAELVPLGLVPLEVVPPVPAEELLDVLLPSGVVLPDELVELALPEVPELVPLELVLPPALVDVLEVPLGDVAPVSGVDVSDKPVVSVIEVELAGPLAVVDDGSLFLSVGAVTSAPPAPPLEEAVWCWRRVTVTGTRSCSSVLAAARGVCGSDAAAGVGEATDETSGWR
jgi:hypothetical protein